MSILREATSSRNESPDRELYGFRNNTLFAPLDLILFEVDGSGNSQQIVPPPSNVEFKGKKIKSGAANIARIASYDVPPIIEEPFVKADRLPETDIPPRFNLNSYSIPETVQKNTPVCLNNGSSGKVVSDGLVDRLYAGSTNSLMVYEVDLGVLNNSEAFHGSQVFIGNTIDLEDDRIKNELLGMLITTAKGAGSFSLVFPASQIL